MTRQRRNGSFKCGVMVQFSSDAKSHISMLIAFKLGKEVRGKIIDCRPIGFCLEQADVQFPAPLGIQKIDARELRLAR